MNFSIALTADQINIVLRMLDQGPHAQVRQVIDSILAQVQQQQNAGSTHPAPEVPQ